MQQAGELVFRERALLSVQFPASEAMGVRACHHCMMTFEMVIVLVSCRRSR